MSRQTQSSAQAVHRMTPAEVNASGVVMLGYAPEDDTFARAVEKGRSDVLAALQGCFEGVTGFALRAIGAPASVQQVEARRITASDVSKQKLEQLTKRDPLLDAAVRALDLEMLD